jgi:hypothetical protein
MRYFYLTKAGRTGRLTGAGFAPFDSHIGNPLPNSPRHLCTAPNSA